ncbi:MAG: hypothetical protein JXR37_35070 [Kiritimatiellae bacterium]|nr:hypothetical protein [Kiritimatiellia bacterium]
MPRRVLFVCSANVNRSPTAARVFKAMLTEAGYRVYEPLEHGAAFDVEVRSAGVYAADSGEQMDKDLGDGMDEIFAMDESVVEDLIERYGQPRDKIVDLDIEDVYPAGDPELVALLRERLAPYVRGRYA